MNATTTGITPEQYLARVRAALADLPAEEREELLDDLAAHLADVTAETTTAGVGAPRALEDRLGSPEEYAAELRVSAGFGPTPQPEPGGFAARASRRLSQLSAALEQRPAWRRFRAFAPQLRPGWWVLRGYLAALGLAVSFAGLRHVGVTPEFDDALLIFLAFAAVVIWASVWLGKRSQAYGGVRRAAVYALNAVVIIAALALASTSSSEHGGSAGYDDGGASPMNWVDDVYVYDSEGRPLTDVQLFDQYGNPIVLPGTRYVRQRADGSIAENVYPRGAYGSSSQREGYPPMDQPPPSVPPLLPRAPAGSASPSGSPSPGPSPTGTPTSPQPTATPTR